MINFYKCNTCGNIVMFLNASGVIPNCCGNEMEKLVPGIIDGSKEKHIPVVVVHNNEAVVTVGSQPHPMTTDHHIDWIVLETNKGIHVTYISRMSETASAGFTLQNGERVIAAYEHCNLHGLWMCEA